jgi:hypothetical protein
MSGVLRRHFCPIAEDIAANWGEIGAKKLRLLGIMKRSASIRVIGQAVSEGFCAPAIRLGDKKRQNS